MTDENGRTMTMTENPQRERAQHDQAAQTNQQYAAEQRQAAAHVGTAVSDARSERTRARHLGADTRRLEDAGRILDAQINGREDMGVLRPGNALRHGPGGPEQGTGNLAAVAEFVHRVFIMGELPFDVLEDMHATRGDERLAPAEQHAQEAYRSAYRLESAPTVKPALPPGSSSKPSNGVPQQRREPIAPLRPPMVPPAPPESPAEQTGAIALKAVASLRKAGEKTEKSEAALAQLNGGKGPDFGPSPDPRFGASSVLPQTQTQTQTFPRVEEPTQVFSPFFGDEEQSADGTPEPRPFLVPRYAPEATDEPAVSPARAASEESSAAGSEGDGDDDES